MTSFRCFCSIYLYYFVTLVAGHSHEIYSRPGGVGLFKTIIIFDSVEIDGSGATMFRIPSSTTPTPSIPHETLNMNNIHYQIFKFVCQLKIEIIAAAATKCLGDQ